MADLIRFSHFAFDPTTGELAGPAGVVRLQPQPAQVLRLLLSRPGDLVTREELKLAVWPDTVVEADQGLNYCVRQIRAALGDEAERGLFIETLPKRGYRFVGPLEAVKSVSVSLPRATPPMGAVAAALLPVAALVVLWLAERPQAAHSQKLAVLPLVSRSTAPEWIRMADQRLTEQLVAGLTNADSMRIGVVGPATTARLVDDSRPHTVIGNELGVDYVLSGGVRTDDSTLFVQVIRVRDGVHAYAFRRRAFDIDLDSLSAAVVAGVTAMIWPRQSTAASHER
jgi:DNA-binding winged helix-turn-helix (wHTH) protein/TolB-like protein